MPDKYIEFSLVTQRDISSSPIEIRLGQTSEYGVKNRSLGTVSFIQVCSTCESIEKCFGHNGKIKINIPLFKVAFLKNIEPILKLICYECGFFKNPEIYYLLDKISNNNNIITIEDRIKFKNIINNKNKNKCGQANCNKQILNLKYTKNGTFTYVSDVKKECSIEIIYKYFLSLTKNFKRLMTPTSSHKMIEPENVFYYNDFLIISNYIRQPNIYEGIITDPLTTELNAIIKNIYQNKYKKAQLILNSIDNNKGINPYNTNKKLTLEILAGGHAKDSYLRSNINGKRIPGTSRAVIGPNPNLSIGFIEIPEFILNSLIERLYFNPLTEKYILKTLRNPDHELVTFIKTDYYKTSPYKIINIQPGNNNIIAPEYGDHFEKKKAETDLISYCRQPSLHQWNIQSAEIKKTKSLTTNIPTPVCTSSNADFDGDEMTKYNFQNPNSNIEQCLIMNSKMLLKNVSTGTTMFGLIQDQVIVMNILLNKENIPLEKAYLIFGKYIYFIKYDKKKYSGKELLSFLFPDHFTYKNIIIDGNIVTDKFTSSMLVPNSYNSIFNILSQIYGNNYTITIIDIVKTILQNYIYYYGYSISITDIIPDNRILTDISEKVYEYVNKINSNIYNFIDDLNKGKTFILSYDEILDLKLKNIEKLQIYIKDYMLDVIKKYYKKDNSFIQMYYAEYKLSLNDIINILCYSGQKKQKDIPIPNINGKTSLYSLPGDMNIESSGFVISPIIKGLTYNEYVMAVKEESLPQIVNVTSGTSQAGYMGKKIVKYASEIIINYDKFITSTKKIINFNPNGLKISQADMSKVDIYYPNQNMIWYDKINQIFNLHIKPYLLINNNTCIIKELDFFINIRSEILIYYYKNKNKNKNTKINKSDIYDTIINFYEQIKIQYFYMLAKIDYILYILLIYFDPSGYIYKDNNIPGIKYILNINLINYIFDKIIFKLNYSLSPGTPIGYQNAHTIQEKFTQQSLSSFHSSSKSGNNITKSSTEEFKQLIELSKKDREDIVTCLSENYEYLLYLKNKFEYISFKDLNIYIDILEENESNKFCLYELTLSIKIIISKQLNISIIYNMLKKYCERCYILKEYYIILDINNDKITILLGVIFYNEYTFNYNKHYFKISLLDGPHKGKSINTNLEIIKLKTYQIENYKLEEKKIYELNFFIEDIYDFKNINTQKLTTILLPPWITFYLGGIQYMKINVLGKAIKVMNDNNYSNPLKHFFDIRFSNSRPTNIKKNNDKYEIIKSANHGNNTAFINAGFNNMSDPCNDVYSSLFVCQKPNFGTNYYKFYLDPNLYDKLNKKIIKRKENHLSEEDQILSII